MLLMDVRAGEQPARAADDVELRYSPPLSAPVRRISSRIPASGTSRTSPDPTKPRLRSRITRLLPTLDLEARS